jgi:endonuclease/exonuclease/phosphatase family metal-dependent hydrolase
LHWNTHHGGVGTDGKWDPSRLMDWVVRMNPDVASFNEVEMYGTGNADDPALFASLLKQKTGVTWYYHFTTGNGAARGIGNLMMSRYPLDAYGTQLLSDSRAIVNVTITVNGRTINVSSTHLDDASTTMRQTEIGEMTTWARSFAEQRIICGDMNAGPTSVEHAKLKSDYTDTWEKAVAAGTAIAYPGNTAGNTRNTRIDYIYTSNSASMLVLQSSQVVDTRDANGVMPSDHRPLLSIFTVK